jgi:hypothetical protein
MRLFTFFEAGEIYHEQSFPERDRYSLFPAEQRMHQGKMAMLLGFTLLAHCVHLVGDFHDIS